MKPLLILLTLCATMASAQAPTPPDKAPTGQQARMTRCNQSAGEADLKGDERKQFMSRCLKGETEPTAGTPQQERMKACNADAGAQALKGDERKAFMKKCLSNAPATPQERMKSCNTEATAKALTGDARKQFMGTCLKG